MVEASSFKCIKCNEFYKRTAFFKKDIYTMQNSNKLLFCKKCVIYKKSHIHNFL